MLGQGPNLRTRGNPRTRKTLSKGFVLVEEWNPIGIILGAVQERTPPRLGNAEEKRYGLPLRTILRTIPWNRTSVKKEQDKGKPKNI